MSRIVPPSSKPSTSKLYSKPKRAKDHTSLWSRISWRKQRYNRMDPDPDPESDESPVHSRPHTRDKDGNIKLILTKDDWKKFWVERLRRVVDAPTLTDKDLSDAVDRSRRIYLRQREENRKVRVDPDIPACFYWDKFKVADWVEAVGLPEAVKKMLLHCGISGRHLVTLDANKLLHMGLYELGAIKAVTKAVRDLLGLPHTNGLRAIARVPPLETFLKLKVRTGPTADKFTFKEFCEEQGIEYEPAKKQMVEGYQPIPGCCHIEIKPDPRADVKWIPIKVHKPNKKNLDTHSDYDYQLSDSDLSGSSSKNSLLDKIPTVEELARDVLLRNTFMPQILNDIVEAVYEKVTENRKMRKECYKQQLANEVVKNQLDKAYSDFKITEPEDKLKFVTIIAEELVEDVMRAKEIIEDIDKFQARIKTEIPEEDMKDLQVAVAFYVQNIMPVVVSAALKEMEESATNLHCDPGVDYSRFDDDSESDERSQTESDLGTESSTEPEAEPDHPEPEVEESVREDVEVIWDRTFVEDYKPFSSSQYDIL